MRLKHRNPWNGPKSFPQSYVLEVEAGNGEERRNGINIQI